MQLLHEFHDLYAADLLWVEVVSLPLEQPLARGLQLPWVLLQIQHELPHILLLRTRMRLVHDGDGGGPEAEAELDGVRGEVGTGMCRDPVGLVPLIRCQAPMARCQLAGGLMRFELLERFSH